MNLVLNLDALTKSWGRALPIEGNACLALRVSRAPRRRPRCRNRARNGWMVAHRTQRLVREFTVRTSVVWVVIHRRLGRGIVSS